MRTALTILMALLLFSAARSDDVGRFGDRGLPLQFAPAQDRDADSLRIIHGTWSVTSASYQSVGRQTYHFFDDKLVVSSFDSGGKQGPRHADKLVRQRLYSASVAMTLTQTNLSLTPFPHHESEPPVTYSVRVHERTLWFKKADSPNWVFALQRVPEKRITK